MEPLLPELDEPPKSGVCVDHDELELTEDDCAVGNQLGWLIDADDDSDNGEDLL